MPKDASLNFTHDVLAIIGSTRIGCHGIVVSPEDPPLGTFHRTTEEVADTRDDDRPACEEVAEGRSGGAPAVEAVVAVAMTQPQVAESGMDVAEGHNRYKLDLVPDDQEGSFQLPSDSPKKIGDDSVPRLCSSGDEDLEGDRLMSMNNDEWDAYWLGAEATLDAVGGGFILIFDFSIRD